MKINKDRMFASLEEDFVVFLIGMRINNLWKVHKWFPVAKAMPKMLKELVHNPSSGFLGFHNWFGRNTIMIQYWRSFEHLEAYAKDKPGEHYPTWRDLNRKVRSSGAVGIWHETYEVQNGNYENIYVNMPAFGLRKVGKLISVSEKYDEGKNENEFGNMKIKL